MAIGAAAASSSAAPARESGKSRNPVRGSIVSPSGAGSEPRTPGRPGQSIVQAIATPGTGRQRTAPVRGSRPGRTARNGGTPPRGSRKA